MPLRVPVMSTTSRSGIAALFPDEHLDIVGQRPNGAKRAVSLRHGAIIGDRDQHIVLFLKLLLERDEQLDETERVERRASPDQRGRLRGRLGELLATIGQRFAQARQYEVQYVFALHGCRSPVI